MADVVTRVTHAFRKRGLNVNSRALVALCGLILIIGLLAAARLVLVSQVAAAGRHLQAMRHELSELRRENATLELEIARHQVAGVMLQQAKDLGLRPVYRIELVELQEE
jgi:hypothetical protein